MTDPFEPYEQQIASLKETIESQSETLRTLAAQLLSQDKLGKHTTLSACYIIRHACRQWLSGVRPAGGVTVDDMIQAWHDVTDTAISLWEETEKT